VVRLLLRVPLSQRTVLRAWASAQQGRRILIG